MDDEAIRVSVGLRLGANLCVQHTCPCGAPVDCTGIHGLSCRLAFGRQPRHHLVNDIIWRAMSSAGVPSSKEPVGLLRDDGKRPDGMTLIPWSRGKPVTWDVTVVDPLAQSYLHLGAALSHQVQRQSTLLPERRQNIPRCHLVTFFSQWPSSVWGRSIPLGPSLSRTLAVFWWRPLASEGQRSISSSACLSPSSALILLPYAALLVRFCCMQIGTSNDHTLVAFN
jgi:hypothetical protein